MFSVLEDEFGGRNTGITRACPRELVKSLAEELMTPIYSIEGPPPSLASYQYDLKNTLMSVLTGPTTYRHYPINLQKSNTPLLFQVKQLYQNSILSIKIVLCVVQEVFHVKTVA